MPLSATKAFTKVLATASSPLPPPLPPPVPHGLAALVAEASVPEQLVPYVLAVSENAEGVRSKALACGGGLAYLRDKALVLVAYPAVSGQESRSEQINAAVDQALATFPNLERLTVLAPARPSAAPADAVSQTDSYWGLPVPCPPPSQKVRNMLHRAQRELVLVCSQAGQSPGERLGWNPDQTAQWTPEHVALVEAFIRTHPLAPGSVHIFRRIENYLALAPASLLFSARSRSGRLEGFCVGDYSGLVTAFYMFAFRRPDAVPGTADALMAALLDEAAACGHRRINLGLGIDAGIAFFKKKWGARPLFPYVETAWKPVSKAWWRKWL